MARMHRPNTNGADLASEQLAFRKYVYPVIEIADRSGDYSPLMAILESADPVIGRIHRKLFEDTDDPAVASVILLLFIESDRLGRVTALEYYLFGDPIEALLLNSRFLGPNGPEKLKRLASEEGMSIIT